MSEYVYGLEALQTVLMFDPNRMSNHQHRAPILDDYINGDTIHVGFGLHKPVMGNTFYAEEVWCES